MPQSAIFHNEPALRIAIKQAKSQAEMLDILDVSRSSGNAKYLTEALARFGLVVKSEAYAPLPTVSAVPRGRFADDEAVRQAVSGAKSYRQACLALGVSVTANTYALLDDACARLSIDPPPLSRAGRGVGEGRRLRRGERFELVGPASLEQVCAAVQSAVSRSEVLDRLGIRRENHYYHWLSRFCEVHGIELPAYTAKGRDKTDLVDVLVVGKRTSSSNLRRRLVEECLLKNECCLCGQLPEWQNQPLTLQLDHINGNTTDNRLENLRVLCPHCHTQTATWGGRNRRKKGADTTLRAA